VENANQTTQNSDNIVKKLTIEEIFSDKRAIIKSDIERIINNLKNLNSLMLGQTEAYSERHLCVDEIHKLMDIYNKLQEKYKSERFKVRNELKAGDRYAKDISEEIDSKTSSIKKQLDTINSQIEFFKETIKTLDQMLYGIKYRLDYENN
jgi:predicted  nucleic acid-binding Zn-ribbon protein